MTKTLMAREAAISLKSLNHTVNHEPRILDVELAASLGLARPREIRDVVIKNKTELESFGSLAVTNRKSRGQEYYEYWLNEAQALLLCMFSRTEKAAAVRKQVIDVFIAYRHGQLASSQSREVAISPPAIFKEPPHPFKAGLTLHDLEALFYTALGQDKDNAALQGITRALTTHMEKVNNSFIMKRNEACRAFYASQKQIAA